LGVPGACLLCLTLGFGQSSNQFGHLRKLCIAALLSQPVTHEMRQQFLAEIAKVALLPYLPKSG
jgi:hypothetical protein